MKEEAIRNHIESDTTPAAMSLHEAIAGARLLMDFAPNGRTPTIELPREAVAALLHGVANTVVWAGKHEELARFIHEQTGTRDLGQAAAYLKALRFRATANTFTKP